MTLLQLATWFSVPLVRIIRGAATGRGLTSMADPAEPEATSTAVGSAIPLQIDVLDIIKAIRIDAQAIYAQVARMAAPQGLKGPSAPEAGETMPCTCETEGRCASCDRLPWVVRQRLAVSDLQTTRTVNSSPSSWDTDTDQPTTDAAQVREQL